MKIAEIVLVSTLHDSRNRLLELIISHGGVINQIFRSSYIVVTPSTSQQTIDALGDLGFKTSKGSKTMIIAYKKALKNALTNNSKNVFY